MLGPQGQYVSTLRVSDDSLYFPGPFLTKNELPQMLVLPSPRKDSGHLITDFDFSRSGPICSLMSECMSVTKMSRRPSLLKSKTLIPIAPHDVRGNTWRLFLAKLL